MKLINREPTIKMALAMIKLHQSGGWTLPDIYRAAYDAAPEIQQEPAEYQYQGRNGFWYRFDDPRHYRNTVKDGSWPIRALYALPPDAQAEIARLRNAAPEIQQEPVAWRMQKEGSLNITCYDMEQAESYAIDGYELIGAIYALPPDAQAEIAKLKAMIVELEQEATKAWGKLGEQCEAHAKTINERDEQAERIAQLEFSWAGCSQQLKDACDDLNRVEKQRDELAAQNQQLLAYLKAAYDTAVNHDERLPFDWAVYCEMLYQATNALPDLASQHLNRVKAEALRSASSQMREITCDCGVPCDCFTQGDAIRRLHQMADAIEKGE